MKVDIEKHENDILDYRGYQLENQIKLIIVSDPKSMLSACSFSMDVGNFHSPKNYEGLPHFLEHMIFLGSKKYPDENYFANFISNNGGIENAYTTELDTNYYFSIKNDKLLESLDIFLNLLKEPLFNKKMVDKEINAIESEFNSGYNKDSQRFYHLLKKLSNENSKFNNFDCGNKNTLNKEDIYEKLLDFYNNNYNTDKLSISISTNKKIEEIEKDILNLLSQLKFKENTINLNLKNEIKPFDKNNLKKFVKFKNMKKVKVLRLFYFLEEVSNYHYIKPLEYYSHLFGHESKGSIIYELKKKDLANSLCSISNISGDYFSSISIEIKLTNKGFENYNEVIQIVFNYIKIIKSKGIQKYIWDEISQLKYIQYSNKNKQNEINKVISLSETIKEYGLKEANSLYYKMNKYDENVLNKFDFELENCIIFLSSDTFDDLDLLDKYYNINYSIENLNFEIKEIENNMNFPEINCLIPKKFEKINNCNEEPKLIIDDKYFKIFLFENNKFNSKIALNMFIKTSDNYYEINYKKLILSLWVKLFLEYCNNFIYQAEIALIKFDLFVNEENIEFEYYGFSDSFEIFFEKIIKYIISFSKDLQNNKLDNMFNLILEKFKLDINSSIDKNIHKVTLNLFKRLITNFVLTPEENYKIIKNINYNSFKEFDNLVFNEIKFELIINGNILKENINIIEKNLKNLIDYKKCEFINRRYPLNLCEISKEYNFLKFLPESEKNNSYFLSIPLGSEKNNRFFCLGMTEYINSNFFDEIRTNQQLGYHVYTNYTYIRGYWYFNFYIQSNVKHSLYLKSKCLIFLNDMTEKILKLPNDELKEIINNSIIKIKKEYKSLKEQNNEFILEIKNKQYLWNKRQVYCNIIKNMDADIFKNIIKNQLNINNTLNIHINSNKFKEDFLKDLKNEKYDMNNNKIYSENNLLIDMFY